MGLVIFLCTSCATTSPSGSSHSIKAIWLPPTQVWKVLPQAGIRLKYPNGTTRHVPYAMVRHLGEVLTRLNAVSGVKARLALVDTDLPNAFAFRNNNDPVIALSLSWLQHLGQDRDALATTMGHEMAHLQLGHSGQEQQRRETVGQGVSQVLGTALGFIIPFGGTLTDLSVTAFVRSFSRDEERAADKQGLLWAVSAGYDPCGQATTMLMYQKIQNSSASWLSTHPGAEERITAANTLSQKIRGRSCDASGDRHFG